MSGHQIDCAALATISAVIMFALVYWPRLRQEVRALHLDTGATGPQADRALLRLILMYAALSVWFLANVWWIV